MIERQDIDDEELIRAEDVDKVLSEEETDDKDKHKYKVFYSKDVLEKDLPAIPPTIRSKIIKKIEEKLTTDPLKAGIPFRGKIKKD